MERQPADPRVAVFERAADRLKLTGRRRAVGRMYFLGLSLKEIRRDGRVREGTLKGDLVFLRGRLGAGDRVEFVHRTYEVGDGAQRGTAAAVLERRARQRLSGIAARR